MEGLLAGPLLVATHAKGPFEMSLLTLPVILSGHNDIRPVEQGSDYPQVKHKWVV